MKHLYRDTFFSHIAQPYCLSLPLRAHTQHFVTKQLCPLNSDWPGAQRLDSELFSQAHVVRHYRVRLIANRDFGSRVGPSTTAHFSGWIGWVTCRGYILSEHLQVLRDDRDFTNISLFSMNLTSVGASMLFLCFCACFAMATVAYEDAAAGSSSRFSNFATFLFINWFFFFFFFFFYFIAGTRIACAKNTVISIEEESVWCFGLRAADLEMITAHGIVHPSN